MKKMKRFLVALLSCLTAVACVAGISACKDDKKTASNDSSSSVAEKPSYDINIVYPGEENCVHEYGVVYTKPATCEYEGMNYIACTKCGKNDIEINHEYIDALGHKWVKTEAKEVTCTEDGNYEYETCETCGLVFCLEVDNPQDKDSLVIPALGHTFERENFNYDEESIAVEYKKATCEEDGQFPQWACADCAQDIAEANAEELAVLYMQGKLETEQAIIDKLIELGLPLSEKVVIPAYHTGVVSFIDTYAADFGLTKSIKDDKSIVAASTEDCGIDGFADFKVCKDCEKFNDKLTEAKKAYNDLENKTQVAVFEALTAAGIYTDVDTLTVIETELGHTVIRVDGSSTWVNGKAPTCTEAGTEAYGTCTRCNATVVNNKDGKLVVANSAGSSIEALGHDLDGKKESDITTCNEVAGANVIKCKTCGEVVYTKAHNFVEIAEYKAATCTKDGHSSIKYCTVCNTQEAVVLPKTGHNYTVITTAKYGTYLCQAGTLKSTNIQYEKCQNCDESYRYATIDASTGMLGAYTVKAALNSSDFEATAQPTAHQFKSTAKAADCGINAVDDLCEICGVSKFAGDNEKLYATGKHVNPVGAYCGKDYTCTTCQTVIPAGNFDHVYVVYTNDTNGKNGTSAWGALVKGEYTPATCTKAGAWAYEKCAICGDIRIDFYNDGVFDMVKSNNEDLVEADKTIAQLIHGEKETVVLATESTCTVQGYNEHKICNYCGKATTTKTMKALKAHGTSDPTVHCYSICDKAYPVDGQFNDANNNGVWDNGEEVYQWTGCGQVMKNATNAIHNYNAEDVCLDCGKHK